MSKSQLLQKIDYYQTLVDHSDSPSTKGAAASWLQKYGFDLVKHELAAYRKRCARCQRSIACFNQEVASHQPKVA